MVDAYTTNATAGQINQGKYADQVNCFKVISCIYYLKIMCGRVSSPDSHSACEKYVSGVDIPTIRDFGCLTPPKTGSKLSE
jgi:hypothetical protein